MARTWHRCNQTCATGRTEKGCPYVMSSEGAYSQLTVCRRKFLFRYDRNWSELKAVPLLPTQMIVLLDFYKSHTSQVSQVPPYAADVERTLGSLCRHEHAVKPEASVSPSSQKVNFKICLMTLPEWRQKMHGKYGCQSPTILPTWAAGCREQS